jgi:hypothetical protein
MRSRASLFMTVVGFFFPVVALPAQEMPDPQAMQMQVRHIAQERPREAEAAARAFLQLVAADRLPGLDSLKARSLDQYWMEVAQLTVQFDMVQKLVRRDSARAGLVAQMFGTEAQARALQRAYREAPEAQRLSSLRARIETVITRHFEIEDQLRGLEIADIERRLAEVRAETERRRQKRGELIKWAVDDIVRDATRPF